MVNTKPLIDKSEFKTDFMDSCISGKPHKLYMVYDELMDELIIRLVPPAVPVSVYYLDDNNALLIDLETLQIVGFQFLDFQEEYLGNNKKLQQSWLGSNIAKELTEFREFDYVPKKKNFLEKFRLISKNYNTDLLIDFYCRESELIVHSLA